MFGVLLGKNGAVESTAAVDDVLIKLSAQINEKLPMAVDADTRLDNVSAVPGRHLIYHYTVVTVNGSDINVENFQRLNKPQLKDRLCGSTEMQNFLKNGVTISYLYKGKDGHPIGGTKLAPSECGYKR